MYGERGRSSAMDGMKIESEMENGQERKGGDKGSKRVGREQEENSNQWSR